MVGIRYRLTVRKDFVVEPQFKHLFNNRTTVAKGNYDVTVEAHRITLEREVQDVVRRHPKEINLSTLWTIMD